MLGQADAIVLFVSDLERAKAFYKAKVGLKLKSEEQGFAEFELDNTTIALLDIPTAQAMINEEVVTTTRPSGESSLIAAYVDDLNKVYGALRQRGVEFLKPPSDQPWGQRTAYFKDPDGHLWEVSQWIEG